MLAIGCRVFCDCGPNPAISVRRMKHCSRPPEQDDLLRPRLVDMIDLRHELVVRPEPPQSEQLSRALLLKVYPEAGGTG